MANPFTFSSHLTLDIGTRVDKLYGAPPPQGFNSISPPIYKEHDNHHMTPPDSLWLCCRFVVFGLVCWLCFWGVCDGYVFIVVVCLVMYG